MREALEKVIHTPFIRADLYKLLWCGIKFCHTISLFFVGNLKIRRRSTNEEFGDSKNLLGDESTENSVFYVDKTTANT